MEKNSGSILVIVAGLLLAGTLGDKHRHMPSLPPLPPINSLADEFHRVVGIMDKFDNLSMMALNTLSSEGSTADAFSTSRSESPLSALPDLSSMADALAPLINSFKNEKNL